MLAHFCNAFLIRFSDFRHGNHFEVRWNSFFKITVAESNGWYIFATYGLCVWGQPLFRRALITCPIFSYSSQFTSRGTRHPWPTVCNEATVLDGISGLITLTYLQLVTIVLSLSKLFDDFPVIILSYAWIIREIGVRYAFFSIYPFSATFVQCGQRRPSWTKHVNSRISSGTLLGIKRLIDEIRSFKCVCVWVKHATTGPGSQILAVICCTYW